MIVYTASDLLWSSRIQACARAHDLIARRIETSTELETLLDQAQLVLIDLESEPAGDLIETLKGLKTNPEACPVATIAFAPHIREDLLELARNGGIDRVMTRGAFASGLDSMLSRLAP